MADILFFFLKREDRIFDEISNISSIEEAQNKLWEKVQSLQNELHHSNASLRFLDLVKDIILICLKLSTLAKKTPAALDSAAGSD